MILMLKEAKSMADPKAKQNDTKRRYFYVKIMGIEIKMSLKFL